MLQALEFKFIRVFKYNYLNLLIMKKFIGILVFILAFSTNMDADAKNTETKEIAFESCVSNAHELTRDRPDLFALAYNYCIRQRCGCDA